MKILVHKKLLFFLNLFIIFSTLKCNNNNNYIFSNDDCFDVPISLCSNKGQKILTSLNKPNNLIGWYTFDEIYPIDSSGHNKHGSGTLLPGPSAFIKGQSAYFNGENMLTIKNDENLYTKTNSISLTFWLYLLEDSTDNWRTIITKGNNIQELTPTIMLWPKERRLHVRVSTDMFWNEGIESRGIIGLKQWTFISVVISGQMMQLYINGNLDSQMILKGKVIGNKGDFYIGKDPWRTGTKMYLDDLKIYNTGIGSKQIEAESYFTNPLIGPNYAVLGCEKCTFLEALNSCGNNAFGSYHMCSFEELYSGGYLLARKNGWLKFGTEFWTRESKEEMEKKKKENEIGNPNIMKMTICCSDK